MAQCCFWSTTATKPKCPARFAVVLGKSSMGSCLAEPLQGNSSVSVTAFAATLIPGLSGIETLQPSGME